jgi:hypothetical protein
MLYYTLWFIVVGFAFLGLYLTIENWVLIRQYRRSLKAVGALNKGLDKAKAYANQLQEEALAKGKMS